MNDLNWNEYPAGNAPVLFDARGHRRMGSLFREMSQDQNRDPIFTMRDVSTDGLPSIYEMYMTSLDEYDAIMKIVGSQQHWRKLCSAEWFMEGSIEKGFTGLNQWRQDMEQRDASAAKKLIQDKMADGDLQAAKVMLDIAAGKKERVKKTKAAKTATPRRGTQQAGAVVDIGSAFSNVDPEG